MEGAWGEAGEKVPQSQGGKKGNVRDLLVLLSKTQNLAKIKQEIDLIND